jgi:hypothetical protein
MFDPTTRADVTLRSVYGRLHREHRSAIKIQTKCVKYQHNPCCDGLEILQIETVRSYRFTFILLWVTISNVPLLSKYLLRSECVDGSANLQCIHRISLFSLLVNVQKNPKERCVGGSCLLGVVMFSLSVYRRRKCTRALCTQLINCHSTTYYRCIWDLERF